MLKKVIKYTDFDGNDREETFYFNLTKAELMELEVSKDGGLTNTINRIVEAQDNALIIELFKEVIAKAYGEKSADGKYFVKNDQVLAAFKSTQAYSDLFWELATNAEAASAFMNAIIPPTDKSENKS